MSFDTLAPHYRWMERVLAGEKLQRCRTAFLPIIPTPKHALLVGEGNGRFLTAFRSRFPQTQITCLDASQKMLTQARRSLTSQALIQFVHADIFQWQIPPQHYDLIVTNFFLDCFTAGQLQIIITKLATSATSDATWLLADFCQPSSGWKKWRAQWILHSMYLFFRFVTKLPAATLTAPDDFLRAAGFRLIDRVFHDWGLLHSDRWIRSSAGTELVTSR
jgi:ubiquinone/menaquinone biosynthesis C-methylase UbiE